MTVVRNCPSAVGSAVRASPWRVIRKQFPDASAIGSVSSQEYMIHRENARYQRDVQPETYIPSIPEHTKRTPDVHPQIMVRQVAGAGKQCYNGRVIIVYRLSEAVLNCAKAVLNRADTVLNRADAVLNRTDAACRKSERL